MGRPREVWINVEPAIFTLEQNYLADIQIRFVFRHRLRLG